jgi:hypothetical protein
MPTTYKILGQSGPAATTETVLYTVPASTSTVISTLAICNQSANPATYRIAVRPAADSTTAQRHWVVFGATIDGSDATMLTLGITLAAGDTVRVFSSSATMSFSVFGSEIS